MPDSIQERWVQWSVGLQALAIAWLVISHFTLQARVEAMQLTQSNIISPVVEASLREIRDKGNAEALGTSAQLARLTQIATENSKDISYIRESLAQKKP